MIASDIGSKPGKTPVIYEHQMAILFNNQRHYNKNGPENGRKGKRDDDPYYATFSTRGLRDDQNHYYDCYFLDRPDHLGKVLKLKSTWQTVAGSEHLAECALRGRHEIQDRLPLPTDAIIDSNEMYPKLALPATRAEQAQLRDALIAHDLENIRRVDKSEIAYVLIEYCCSDKSMLSAERYAKAPNGKKVVRVRLTQQHDLTSEAGMRYAKEVVYHFADCPTVMDIWFSKV